MLSFLLIFYMSSGVGQYATGGPSVVDNFSSYESCMEFGEKIRKIKKYDWHVCVEVKK